MLFSDADDPLAALRWNMSQLRRLLGEQVKLEGDPVELVVSPKIEVDYFILLHEGWRQAVALEGLGHDLLEGLSFDAEPAFDLWLTTERVRLRAATDAILREAALAALAADHPGRALEYARRLVTSNPYDENGHVLVARALVAAEHVDEAQRHVEHTIRMFRSELGEAPSPSFRLAALSGATSPGSTRTVGSVTAQIEVGEAAIGAGAWTNGIEALRGAVATAETIGDQSLIARANLSLGGALVHAARGFDEEGAKALLRAGHQATLAREYAAAARAHRELAYIELLRGRYERAFMWLDKAAERVENDHPELAWIESVRGACASDTAHYPAAERLLASAITRAEISEDHAAAAFAHCFLGRVGILRRDLDKAGSHLRQSIDLARASGWTSFVPFPMSLLAETTFLSGAIDAAGDTFDHAFALSCQLGDPCWESLGARGLGLVAETRNDLDSAFARLEEAPRLCRRFPDSYKWIEAYAIESLCRLMVETDRRAARTFIDELETMAARSGMRELLVRALLHRSRLGEVEALETAKAIAHSIENPHLESAFSSVHG